MLPTRTFIGIASGSLEICVLIGGKVGRDFGVKVAEVMMFLILLSMRLLNRHHATNFFRRPIPRKVNSCHVPVLGLADCVDI